MSFVSPFQCDRTSLFVQRKERAHSIMGQKTDQEGDKCTGVPFKLAVCLGLSGLKFD